jgi:hypothetical protein
MVLDSALIPNTVDVVIGVFINELHFKVEEEGSQESAVLLKMDKTDDAGEGGAGKEESEGGAGKEESQGPNNMQIDLLDGGQRDGNSSS